MVPGFLGEGPFAIARVRPEPAPGFSTKGDRELRRVELLAGSQEGPGLGSPWVHHPVRSICAAVMPPINPRSNELL